MKYQDYIEKANQINEIYSQMDRENEKFAKKFNIGCVSCSGQCCQKKELEVSPADLIPLVVKLIKEGTIESIITDLSSKIDTNCIFHINGRCSAYQNRATLCRLFGHVAIFDKAHQNTLSICKEITNEYSHPIARANASQAPNIVNYSQKICNLMPGWDSAPISFNKALNYAINRVYTSYLYEK